MRIIQKMHVADAYLYISRGWTNAVEAMGWKMYSWDGSDPERTFNDFRPDIYIADVRMRHKIPSRVRNKETAVIATVDQWADSVAFPENARRGYETNWRAVRWIRKLDPEFLFHHTTPRGIELGWKNWVLKENRKVISIPLAADTIRHKEVPYNSAYECDIGYAGGYWAYKAAGLHDYLLSYADKYNTMIFGKDWPNGISKGVQIDDFGLNSLYKSAKFTPCIHEPHGRKYGVEITERLFKVPLAGGFTVSDPVAGIYDGFFNEDEIIMAASPREMESLAEYFITNPDERVPFIERAKKRVVAEHTYFHRLGLVLKELGFMNELTMLKQKMQEWGYGVRSLG